MGESFLTSHRYEFLYHITIELTFENFDNCALVFRQTCKLSENSAILSIFYIKITTDLTSQEFHTQ